MPGIQRDFLRDLNFQHELERQLHQAAQQMLRDEKLLPKCEDFVRRLNAWAPGFCSKCGVRVVFR
jgi:hypothetical protein